MISDQPTGYFYAIKQLEMALRPRFMEACAAHGVTLAQYTAMTILERRPGMTSSELARRIFVRAQTMATTLDPLLERGHLRRTSDPAHGRRFLLFLTEAGVEVVVAIGKITRHIEAELVADLSEVEQEQFMSYIRRTRNEISRNRDRTSHG
ncbi:MarR family winged helix-turn-helix transcriptional regulator [Homoserinimonas sp. A520]